MLRQILWQHQAGHFLRQKIHSEYNYETIRSHTIALDE